MERSCLSPDSSSNNSSFTTSNDLSTCDVSHSTVSRRYHSQIYPARWDMAWTPSHTKGPRRFATYFRSAKKKIPYTVVVPFFCVSLLRTPRKVSLSQKVGHPARSCRFPVRRVGRINLFLRQIALEQYTF